MAIKCYRKILCILYNDHVTNEEVHNIIQRAIGPYEDLLTTVKREKVKWYGHVSQTSGLTKTTLQGSWGSKKKRKTEEEVGGKRHRMDRLGFIRDKKGGRREAAVETTNCEVIGGTRTTLRLRD